MMARDNGNRPRHLRAATPGEAPADTPTTADALAEALQQAVDEFKAQACNVIDNSDYVIVIGCVDGFINQVLAPNLDRHKLMGALRDAVDIVTYPPGCDCED